MLKITTAIRNRIPTAGLIFKDDNNKGVNIIYMPEYPNKGIDFINIYRKKNYWDYIIVPPTFTFMGRKILTNAYYKEVRTTIPQLKIQKKFLKNTKELQSIIIDLTPLSEQFSTFIKTRSKKNTIEFALNLINSFAVDSAENTEKDNYLLVDNNNVDEKNIIDSIFYLSKLNANKFRGYAFKGIIAYGNNRYWPLTINDNDKDGEFFKINLNLITRFFKEVHNEEIEEIKIDPKETIKETKAQIENLYKIHSTANKTVSGSISDDAFKKEETLKENPLEAIRHAVNSNPYIKGKTLKDKLKYLYSEGEKEATAEKEAAELPKSTIKKIDKIDNDIKELNRKYNGVIEVNPKIVEQTTGAYYKPTDIIGFNDFHAYDRQSTEFDQNLDEAMFDLIKSLEKDKDLGIQILDIQSEITDNYKDRFKTYRIKLQHKDFGKTKPYTVKFHIPYPAQGKYLKLNGNNFIATNQFFPKPVIKIKPNLVRVYTHYSTVAISLKRHILNEQHDYGKIAEDFSKKLTSAKKASDYEKYDAEDIKFLIEKYDLPENIDKNLFMKINIKDNA